MPAPTIAKYGSSTATPLTSARGPGLRINGGTDTQSLLMATYRVRTGNNTTTAEFTVTAAPNAAFAYSLRGTGGGYSANQLRFERRPGSDQLQVTDAAGPIACGAIPSGRPTTVTVVYTGGAPSQYDVLINGALTVCTDRPTALKPPASGFVLTDPANQGYGGLVEFTNLAMF